MSSLSLIVRYNNHNYDIVLTSKTPSVASLAKEVKKKIGIPPKKQRFSFKGHLLTDSKAKLSSYQIINGSKLLLNASPDEPVKKGKRSTKGVERKTCEKLENPPHSLIIEKGPPPGCKPGNKTQVSRFPQHPFSIYDTAGDLCTLAIETESFWIISDGNIKEPERIFFTSIRNTNYKDIPGYTDQYFALLFNTDDGRRTFYFLPRQYQNLFRQHLKMTELERESSMTMG